MGIRNSIKKLSPFGKRSVYLNKDGTPKTITVSSSGGFSLKGISPFKRNKQTLKTYKKYYEGDGTVFASINTIAFSTVMVGYYIESDNSEAKKLIETRFKEMDVDGVLLDNVIYALIFLPSSRFFKAITPGRSKPDRSGMIGDPPVAISSLS